MLSLTSATSGYSATSTSSFKVSFLRNVYCGSGGHWLQYFICTHEGLSGVFRHTRAGNFVSAHILEWLHRGLRKCCINKRVTSVLLCRSFRRVTDWERSWRRWRPSETSCAGRRTHFRSTSMAVPTPCLRMSCRGIEVRPAHSYTSFDQF